MDGDRDILIKAVKNKLLYLSLADLIHAQMMSKGYCSPLAYKHDISSYLNP